MKEIFKKYLFDKNILVNDGAEEKDEELESLLCTALMAKYGCFWCRTYVKASI